MPEENEDVGKEVRQQQREDPTESASNEAHSEGTPEEASEERGEEQSEEEGEEFAEGVRCSNCGSKVKSHETPSGTRYRCPECASIVSVTEEGKSPAPTPKPSEPSSDVVREPPTPNEVLNKVVKADPKLKGNEDVISWLMQQADLYGVLSTNEVKELLGSTDIKNADKTARRVASSYASALQNEINQDPSLQNDSEWRNLIYKESGYRPPGRRGNVQASVSPVPAQGQETRQNNLQVTPPQAQGPQVGGVTQAGASLGNPAPANFPPSTQMPNWNTRGNPGNVQLQNQGGQPLTEERLHEVLDEREEKKKEKEKEDWIREMITKQQQLVENLNDRVTALEKNPARTVQSGEGGGGSPGIEDYLEDLKSLKESMDELSGEEKEKIPSELAGTLEGINSKLDNMGTPEGEIGPHTMEVEKAKQEAEARKIEAKERRKGFKEIADAIRDTADNVGWSIGEAAARSGERSSNPSQSQSNPQTQMQNQDYFEPKPVRKLEDGTRVMEGCPFVDCSRTEDIEVEEGKTTTTCPDCNRVLTIPAAE